MAKAVAEKLGVEVEFVETPWDAMFAALEADRFDIVANEVTISEERKQKYDLSEPYSISQGVIVTREDDNSIKSLADLKGKRTAQNAHQQLGRGRTRCRRQGRVRRRDSPRPSPCSTTAGWTRSSTTASPCYAYQAETERLLGQDRSDHG